MQVSLSDTGGLERRLEVAVPATEVAKEVQQRLKQLSRTARLKGFRPGKAPLAVIPKQFGEQVHAEVVSDLMRSSFAEAVTQEKLRPAGGPRIEPIALGPESGSEVRGALRGAAGDQAEPGRGARHREARGERHRGGRRRHDREHAQAAAGVHRGRARRRATPIAWRSTTRHASTASCSRTASVKDVQVVLGDAPGDAGARRGPEGHAAPASSAPSARVFPAEHPNKALAGTGRGAAPLH